MTVDVRNTGTRAGDEVLQLYVHDEVSSVTRPVNELKGFQCVSLSGGRARIFQHLVGPNSVDLKRTVLTVTN